VRDCFYLELRVKLDSDGTMRGHSNQTFVEVQTKGEFADTPSKLNKELEAALTPSVKR